MDFTLGGKINLSKRSKWNIHKSRTISGERINSDGSAHIFSVTKDEEKSDVIISIISKKSDKEHLWGIEDFDEEEIAIEDLEIDEDLMGAAAIDPDFLNLKNNINATENDEEIIKLIESFIIKKCQKDLSDFSDLTWK